MSTQCARPHLACMEVQPFFQTVIGSPDGSQFPDPKAPDVTIVSSPGGFADLGGIGGQPPPPNAFVKGDTFTVNFPTPGNYKQARSPALTTIGSHLRASSNTFLGNRGYENESLSGQSSRAKGLV